MKWGTKTWGLQMLLTAATVIASQAALATISNVSATSDATNAYYSYSYTSSTNYYHVYLDTDRNAGTGYSYRGIGANYLIENGALYKYSGTNGGWGWTSAGSVTMTHPTSTSVRFVVSRASLGSPSAINLINNTSAGDNSAIIYQTLSSTTTSTTTTLTTTTTIPTSTVTWTRCATEGGTCSFTGTREVRYGANGTYTSKVLTAPVACNNTTFGDPLVGTTKYCDYSSVVQSTPSTTTTIASTTTTLAPTTTTTVPTTTTTIPTSSTGSSSNVSYTASSATIINPERGFFWMTDCRANPKSVSALQAYRSQNGHSVIHCEWGLQEFKSSPISSAVLQQLQTQINNVRSAGFKMILRFVYTYTDTNDAPLSVVLQHLDQLAPYLQQNADVITTVQTGIIGQWGEMSTSANFGGPSTSTDWSNRKAVLDKLLSVVPANRMIAVRTPQFKTNPYGSTPLSSTEAFTGTARSRVGFYNDCFLSSANDYGTYVTSSDLPLVQNDSKYVTTSGETCAVATQNDCSNALPAMAAVHWSMLHEGYNTSVYDKWKSQGCFTTVQQKLGYRFVLQSGSFSSNAKIGGSMNVSINLRNDGFAAMYNQRPVELVLRNTSTGAVYHVALNADPRRWLPGSPIAINQTVTLPSNIAAGNYALFLNMPDAASSLYGNPYYSVQLANTNVWEASTGFNNLGAVVAVSQ